VYHLVASRDDAMDHASLIVQHADRRRSYVTRQIAGETLIVPVTGHVADLEAIYVLNPVASRIWELLRSPTTSARIAETIASEFEVSVQAAVDDVAEFVESLRSRGLVADAPAGA
jgi:coenzyme PQQ synthesis protein D (PqqD)